MKRLAVLALLLLAPPVLAGIDLYQGNTPIAAQADVQLYNYTEFTVHGRWTTLDTTRANVQYLWCMANTSDATTGDVVQYGDTASGRVYTLIQGVPSGNRFTYKTFDMAAGKTFTTAQGDGGAGSTTWITVDNAAVAENSGTDRDWSAITTITVGAQEFDAGGITNYSGVAVHHLAWWGVRLSAAELTALEDGAWPPFVRPASLDYFYPCDETSAMVDVVGGADLAYTDTATKYPTVPLGPRPGAQQ